MNSQPHDSTEIQNDDISGEASVRIIPGPAGVYQRAKLRKVADTREGRDVSIDTTQEYIRKVVADVGFDDDFTRGPWLSAVDYANANGWVVNGCLDLTVTLKDLSGSLSGTIHHKIINEGGYGKDINVGAALILRNILVFSTKSGHYLNITMKNLVKHTQDEEALNLAMEEEARYARIDQERLQQEEEE
ncbi:hypothetical protein CTI12_AA193830 [Artemisia annua]|uniref:Homologous recombination OB-fold protein OB-fold domain-containing protein n=1 Tax=Artemisia annua TaxID=35608 RepID=A0A2U1P525_ARTAN|nr:hypothetical protein CTI12_AA193830 [Artemisia annua]